MTEVDTCREPVTPKLTAAGWGVAPHAIGEQRTFTNGRIIVTGGRVRRGQQKRADYLHFLWFYFTTEEGFAKIYAASPGTAARNRTMTAPALMVIEVPVPPLPTQQTFVRLQADIAALKAKHAAIRQANAAMIPATLERIFSTEVPAHA